MTIMPVTDELTFSAEQNLFDSLKDTTMLEIDQTGQRAQVELINATLGGGSRIAALHSEHTDCALQTMAARHSARTTSSRPLS